MTTMPPKEEKVDPAFYEELQSQLKEALNAKKAADKALSGVEDQIEKFEGSTNFAFKSLLLIQLVSYLTETSASGNVVKGFENYLRAQARPHRRVAEADIETQRIFSRSSLTHLKVPSSLLDFG
jgi:Histone acetyltransferase subunit NuA4